ncbi:MAG: hypothetical protein A3G81_18570 [Betaproteobacteria bacterium RIFCSPLOWO2_12_FULL_65_14]|nr:MAG: hypothetical protein A3G81_18570 [Betaproteobacteria bacterium RIFCSPLOWO2_12_FULL_65_14]
MAQFDRSAQDVGNLVLLEHVNVTQPDQRLATLFYVVALGGTRDPYIMVGVDNMWVNFGRTQLHLPTREPQLLRGTVGFVVPDLAALRARLQKVAPALEKTKFSWRESEGVIEATCPWGNRFRCHASAPEFGATQLALAYVEFDVPPGTAEGIARFYREVLQAPARAAQGRARVSVGGAQELRFCETRAPLPAYDGHHVAVYIADFSRPYRWLRERALITMETGEHEWRFQKIVDPGSGAPLFEIEHEVRSLRHPLYARPLVNRNPAITNTAYAPGQESFRGTY